MNNNDDFRKEKDESLQNIINKTLNTLQHWRICSILAIKEA